jgi:hypothetical protein
MGQLQVIGQDFPQKNIVVRWINHVNQAIVAKPHIFLHLSSQRTALRLSPAPG